MSKCRNRILRRLQIGSFPNDCFQVKRPDISGWPEVIGLADVETRLLGPEGAIHVFGPQKGLRPDEIELLDPANIRPFHLFNRRKTRRDRPDEIPLYVAKRVTDRDCQPKSGVNRSAPA